MRSTFSILPYINRNKVKADGTTAVLCRITIDGKSSTMATGIYCRPEDWNNKTGVIRTVRENNRLQEFRKSVELAYEDSLKKQNVVSAELLKNTLAKRAVIPTKLLQMGERERERLLARSKEINSTSTYRHSGYYQKYLKEYLTSLGKEDIEFTDITEDFGSSYKAFMKRNKNFSAQQINKCLCWLSKLVYLAVDYEILRANPLEDMEYEKKPAPKHRHISRAELKNILETPMLDPMQELGRRAFLFSTFTGLAYVDIMLLHPHQPEEDQRGGVHPPAPDSGADTRPLQHDRRHEARVSASKPWRDVVRDTRAGRGDRTERKLVLPSKPPFVRNFPDFGGHTHREHCQDDGSLRYKDYPAVRGGD